MLGHERRRADDADTLLSVLPAATAPVVRDPIARCLIKDPKQRLRDIGEARIAIDRAIAGPDERPVEGPAEAGPHGADGELSEFRVQIDCRWACRPAKSL